MSTICDFKVGDFLQGRKDVTYAIKRGIIEIVQIHNETTPCTYDVSLECSSCCRVATLFIAKVENDFNTCLITGCKQMYDYAGVKPLTPLSKTLNDIYIIEKNK